MPLEHSIAIGGLFWFLMYWWVEIVFEHNFLVKKGRVDSIPEDYE